MTGGDVWTRFFQAKGDGQTGAFCRLAWLTTIAKYCFFACQTFEAYNSVWELLAISVFLIIQI